MSCFLESGVNLNLTTAFVLFYTGLGLHQGPNFNQFQIPESRLSSH